MLRASLLAVHFVIYVTENLKKAVQHNSSKKNLLRWSLIEREKERKMIFNTIFRIILI